MTHTYQIDGMHCSSCISKVKNELLKITDITEAQIQLKAPQATITMLKHVSATTLKQAVARAGAFKLTEIDGQYVSENDIPEKKSWLVIYKSLLLIFAYITGIAFVTASQQGKFQWMHWMNNFMGGFFIAFSFFKLLDLKGFAESYSSYDLVAKKVYAYGFIYPFIELGLGISFLVGFSPVLTNTVTFIVMTVSIIGVLQSVFNKRKIKCACLGVVFNLPMSAITIIEDALMIGMSGLMLLTML